jgi:4-nitrophenyl phosphatase
VTVDQECVLIDLDGVIWRGDEAIEGAAGGVALLREAGARVAFFTNNSYPAIAVQLAKLERMGVPAKPEELLSSSQAAAQLVEPGDLVLAVGGPGVLEALAERGVRVIEIASLAAQRPPIAAGGDLGPILLELTEGELPEFSSVVNGADPGLDYRRLALAVRAVRAGARLIGTNSDATYPVGRGVVPGAGAALAALAVASGVTPIVAGKPNEPAAALARDRLGEVTIMIGDRPETDGAFAERLGARFALVLSGVTVAGHGPIEPAPAIEASDLGELAKQLVEG